MTRDAILPPGWDRATLSDVAHWGSGGTPRAGNPEYYGGSIPWAVIGDLNDGIVTKTATTITEKGLAESAAKVIASGTVMVAMYGSIGKLGVAGMPMATNQAIAFARPRDGIEGKYLFWFLRHERDRLNGAGKGATQRNISQTVLKPWPIPVAPTAEQRRIVAAIEEQFSRIDAGFEALQRARRNLQRMRAAVLRAAVTGRLVPPDSEIALSEGRRVEPVGRSLERALSGRRILWRNGSRAPKYREPQTPFVTGLPPLPDGWTYVSLDQLLIGPLSNGRSVPDATTGFPVLRLTALRAGSVDVRERKTGAWGEAEAKPFLVSTGDFLVARGNGSLSLVGRGGLVEVDPGSVAYPDTMIRIRANGDIYNPRFLRLVWDSQFVRSQIERAARTTAGIYKINQEALRVVILPMPPVAEQERIVIEAERYLLALAVTEKMVAQDIVRTARLRQGILSCAFAGRLVSQDPRDEPASILLDRIKASSSGETLRLRRPRRRSHR